MLAIQLLFNYRYTCLVYSVVVFPFSTTLLYIGHIETKIVL